MALPTAQLGSLPNMSMPYSIPTYAKSSASQEAIASFLAGLAGSVGSNLVQNVMSRDYAETPASFFSKLVSGPKENRQQYAQRLERAAAEQAATTAYERQTVESDIDRGFRQGIEDRRLEDARNARYLEAFLRGEDLKAAAKRDKFEWQQRADMQDAEMGARLDMIEREYGFRADLPSEKAKAAEAKWTERLLNERQTSSREGNQTNLSPAQQEAIINSDISALPMRTVYKMGRPGAGAENFNTANPSAQIALENYLAGTSTVTPIIEQTPDENPVKLAPIPSYEQTYIDPYGAPGQPSFFGQDRNGELNQARVLEFLKQAGGAGLEIGSYPKQLLEILAEGWNPKNWKNPQASN